jgi:hypothetical protein
MSHSRGQTFWTSSVMVSTVLIISERSKQCVLTVPDACSHFYGQETQRCRRKSPTAKSVSSQPAPWARGMYGTNLRKENSAGGSSCSACLGVAQWGSRPEHRLAWQFFFLVVLRTFGVISWIEPQAISSQNSSNSIFISDATIRGCYFRCYSSIHSLIPQ